MVLELSSMVYFLIKVMDILEIHSEQTDLFSALAVKIKPTAQPQAT